MVGAATRSAPRVACTARELASTGTYQSLFLRDLTVVAGHSDCSKVGMRQRFSWLMACFAMFGCSGSTAEDAAGAGGQGADAPGGRGDGGGGAAPFEPAACAAPEPVLVAGVDSGLDHCAGGFVHRSRAPACASVFPRDGQLAPCVALAEEQPRLVTCVTDLECGPGNHCNIDSFCLGSCACAANGCSSDADCGVGFACRCGALEGACVAASCRADADCADGALCLETRYTFCGMGAEYETVFGFTCQSPEDACLTDDDCPSGELCQGGAGQPRRCEALEACEGSSCGP